MYKREIRDIYKTKRNSIGEFQIEELSLEVSNRLLKMPIWHFFYYHIFLSISKNKEIDTTPILSILQGKDKNVVVPKIIGDGLLQNYLLTDSTVIKENHLGIPEPENGLLVPEHTLDVVFVPLLAFDLLGNRVGYGGGYYDRLLQKCRSETIKVGLSLFEPLHRIKDVYKNDVQLNYAVTPEKIYSF